jgi:hypothetical protein
MKLKRIFEKIVFLSVILAFLIFIVWSFSLSTSTPNINTRRWHCLHNLQSLSEALSMYARDNDLEFPPQNGEKGLIFLRKYISNIDFYNCLKDPNPNKLTVYFSKIFAKKRKKSFQTNYVYLGGFRKDTKPPAPILFDELGNHMNYCNVLFSDGKIEGVHFKYATYDDLIDYLGKRKGYNAILRRSLREKIAEALTEKR